MKTKTSHILSILLLIAIVIILAQGSKIENLQSENRALPNMVIPKDYKSLTQDDNIYGWYANDTLYIDYNNMGYYQDVNP